MYFHNVFWGNFNFNLCIGYLAKLGGHLLLRDEIDVMLEGKYCNYNEIFIYRPK